MEKKPIKQFLDSLPEPARSNAYENIDESTDLNEPVESMAEALGRSFDHDDLDKTRQGFQYWYDIITKADHDYQVALHIEQGLDYSHLVRPL